MFYADPWLLHSVYLIACPNTYCGVKINSASAHSNHPLKLTKMTYVMQYSNFSLLNEIADNTIKYYQVQVVTFDGESEIVEVDAHSETEAVELAAELVTEADYAFVIGVC